MMENTFPYSPSKNKNFSMHWNWVKNFLLSQNTNFTSKKFISRLHSKLKFFCLLHMIAHSFPYHPPRNKNFSMHTPWDKNFLLSKNTKFSTKKFLPLFHSKLKFFCLLHMMAQLVACHLPRNKNFSMQWNWDKNFLLSKNKNFPKTTSKKNSSSVPHPAKIMKP